MKFLITLVISTVLLVSTEMIAQNRTITATVINISSNDGKVGFALYNKASFMQTPIQGKDVEIINGKSIVIFKNVVPGEYAVVCYHDKNNNGKMDFSPQRMPLEAYGSSNNHMAFAPPTFENAKFVVSDKDVSLDIKF